EARISAGIQEAAAAGVFVGEAGLVPDQIETVAHAGGVHVGDQGAQAGLGAVEGGISRRADIEAIVLIVADRLVAAVGASGGRSIDVAVAGGEEVGHAVFKPAVGILERLKDRGRRSVISAAG